MKHIFGLWLILRIFASLLAAFFSSLAPITPMEQAIPLWPPENGWIERVFLSPWNRWDTEWYARILVEGYQSDNGTAAFHPLLVWLATPLYAAGLHPIFSLLVVNSIASLLLFLVFEKLAGLNASPSQIQTSIQLLAFFPMSFILFAPYTEALYLLWVALFFYLLNTKRWWLAGLVGALATLTRQQGLLLALPMAVAFIASINPLLRKSWSTWRDGLSVSLIPAGMGVWLFYRAFALNDVGLSSLNPRELLYSVLLSPSTNQVSPTFRFLWPWDAMRLALEKAFTQPDIDIWTNLTVGAVLLIFIVLSWRYLDLPEKVYTLVIVLIALSDYTGPIHPYMGLPRHMVLALPMFIGLSRLFDHPSRRLAYISLGFFGWSFLLMQFVFHSWVP